MAADCRVPDRRMGGFEFSSTMSAGSGLADESNQETTNMQRNVPWVFAIVVVLECLFPECLVSDWRVTATAQEPILPEGTAPAPLVSEHFPDRVHEFVWRNWNFIEPVKLAALIGTTPEKIASLADSMGLPAAIPIPPEYLERGYSTIIRRNWHLLPYEQLLQLLDMSPARLSAILREEDFLFIKLGSAKPKCEPLRYREPDAAARKRAADIRRIVGETFGEEMHRPIEPRFEFVHELSAPPEPGTPSPPGSQAPESLRLVHSYLSLFGDPLLKAEPDPYPDGFLQRLSAVGVNGVWLHAVLRDLAPGGVLFPEFGGDHEKRLANLRAIVARARKHGIGVYLYINEPRAMPDSFFKNRPQMAGVRENEFTALCTSSPEVRKWMGDALAHVFREVPDLAGIYAITASENLTNCASHGKSRSCERCKDRSVAEIISEVATVLDEGVHRVKPDARVILADWGWKPWGRSSEFDPSSKTVAKTEPVEDGALAIISRLPKTAWLMSVSEWDLPIERGGIKTLVGEYAISAVGPGPRALSHWAAAKEAGLTVTAEVQFNNTTEIASLPYLPVMDSIAEHCSNLAPLKPAAMLVGWTMGGYPSPNFELARQFDATPPPDVETALDNAARKRFGSDGAPHARKAWTLMSDAYREFPFHIAVVYNSPAQYGPANLMHAAKTNYKAAVWGIPYDDLDGWRGPYPRKVFASQFAKLADLWEPGVAELEVAVRKAPAERRVQVEADARYARAVGILARSVANQAEFVMARDALADTSQELSAPERERLQAEIRRLLQSEIRLARELYPLAREDSKIGFEPSCQYFYVPADLIEKVINCRWLLDRFQEDWAAHVESKTTRSDE